MEDKDKIREWRNEKRRMNYIDERKDDRDKGWMIRIRTWMVRLGGLMKMKRGLMMAMRGRMIVIMNGR